MLEPVLSAAPPSGVWCVDPVDRVVYGRGAIKSIGTILDEWRLRRVFVVTSPSLASTDVIATVRSLLGARCVGVFSGTQTNLPESVVVDAAAQAAAADPGVIVGVGGGSSIDCAKLVAHTLREGAWGGFCVRVPARLRRTIAIPTTLVGAPFTAGVGVMRSPCNKSIVRHRRLVPDAVVLDADLTRRTPEQLWTASGIKAMDHALERLLAPERQPVATALARDALRRLVDHLPASVVPDPIALEHRTHCQIAAWHAMFGPHNTSWGASTTTARVIGARFGLPHALTSCITMPHVINYYARHFPERLDLVADALLAGQRQLRHGETVAERLTDLVVSLGLPTRLRDIGIGKGDIGGLAAAVRAELRERRIDLAFDIADVLHLAW